MVVGVSRLRRLLTGSSGRWVATALALAATLPALVDLHVFAESVGVAHDAYEAAVARERLETESCEHERSTHVEAGSAVSRGACSVCLLRHLQRLAADPPRPFPGLLDAGVLTATPEGAVSRFAPSLPLSRGPPRS